MRRCLASMVVVAAAAGPAVADEVQDRVDRAMQYYEAADLGRALDELQAAYALTPRPDIAFAMGKIHVERGECAKAIVAYRRFLESRPGPSSTQIATEAIAQCQKVLVATGEPVPPEAAEPAKRADGGDATDDVTRPPPHYADLPPAIERVTRMRPWYGDTLGNALVAGGTGALVLGGVLALSAGTDVERAELGAAGGVSFQEYTRLADAAERKQMWAMIAAGAGGALVVGGVLRYVLADRTETVIVEPVVGPEGASMTARWRF